MIILKQYSYVFRNGIYYVKPKEPTPLVCPDCGGPLKVRDSKKRRVIWVGGEVRTFLFRRLKCQSCGALHQEIPDSVLPHKHYSRDVIELVLNGDYSCCPAEDSTIYRWNKEQKERAEAERESGSKE